MKTINIFHLKNFSYIIEFNQNTNKNQFHGKFYIANRVDNKIQYAQYEELQDMMIRNIADNLK